MPDMRTIEVDKDALVVLPATDARSIDAKKGAIVVLYDPSWSADAIAKVVAAAKG